MMMKVRDLTDDQKCKISYLMHCQCYKGNSEDFINELIQKEICGMKKLIDSKDPSTRYWHKGFFAGYIDGLREKEENAG